ncbi:Signal transduction histidine kinase [Candidatus Nitrosarchaeum limnium SFB1]|uniref:histidine kinase n=1 Tax=Candidatus Nitrosarchaeum limnium SFB1 TaxID=886738 RepID=F3KJ14_9ARCH|nr:Signal transduction histidine kinase [Candidatus Nitrosarchaeum limnium SFB1]
MDEINQNFNYHIEYDQTISNFENIKDSYDKQASIFERLVTEKNHNDIGNFWIYNTKIKNELKDFNNLVVNNQKTGDFLSISKSSELQRNFDSLYELHMNYENNASLALNYYYEGNQQDFLREYDNIKYQQLELFEKIDIIMQTLRTIPDSSMLSIGYIVDSFQTFQIIMIVLLGIITTMLVFFLNQTNVNLKMEIKNQTENLNQLNKKLQEMDLKRKEFISIASHELKGPLQPIFGFVELAKTKIISKQEALEGISSIAFHLENIANNVLDLTKIENNELELHLEKCSINNIIQEVVESENFNPERKVPIKIKLDVDVMLNLDKTRIKQVFRNILDNCIKFTEVGEIKIQTNLLKNQKTLKLFFSDTGPEIPNEVLPKMFHEVVTMDINKISGFGLGLYISKKIIDAHKGKISAYNHNNYPMFEITLPLITFEYNQNTPHTENLEKSIKNN